MPEMSLGVAQLASGVNFQYRRARSLAYFIKDGKLTVFNFLTNRSFSCNLYCFEVLIQSEEWRPLNDLLELTEDLRTTSLVEEIIQLFSLTALVVEGDMIATKDAEYEATWEWGPVSGLLHFSSQNNPTVNDQTAAEIQVFRSEKQPSPPLIKPIAQASSITLPKFALNCELNTVMRIRRSIRSFLNNPIELSVLADALFAGLGITGVVSTDLGDHPLRMTPSPGARNAYEGYVFARNIVGLSENRFYRYSGFDHALELVPEISDPPTMEAMFADNQPWVRNASGVILLVAHFERVMWKYLNGNAYGHALIEAGHIAQNMMLLFNKYGLVANPAGAITHALIERAIAEDTLTHSVIYALAVGHPDTSDEYVSWLSGEFSIRQALLSKFPPPSLPG